MTETHAVARAMIERRSWRIFMDTPLEAEQVEAIERLAALAPSVRGGRAARAEVVSDPDRVPGLNRAVSGGFIGKANLWMRSSPPPGFAVLVGDSERGVRHGPHHLYNVDVAVAGELVALAAADQNLGGCWMAAIDMGSVARYMDLAEHERVPAVIALGAPGIRRKGALLAAAWNRVTRVSVSGRRKAIEEICSLDRHGSGESLPAADLATMPDDGRTLAQVAEAACPCASFAGETPDVEQLAWILEAMRVAPSADNAQTWRFVVVRGAQRTGEVLAAAGLDVPADGAPGALLALFAAPFIVKKVHKEQPFALIDHPIALTHGLLAAEALGLRWNATFMFDGASVRDMLGVPENWPPTALFALDRGGERAGDDPPDWVQLYR